MVFGQQWPPSNDWWSVVDRTGVNGLSTNSGCRLTVSNCLATAPDCRSAFCKCSGEGNSFEITPKKSIHGKHVTPTLRYVTGIPSHSPSASKDAIMCDSKHIFSYGACKSHPSHNIHHAFTCQWWLIFAIMDDIRTSDHCWDVQSQPWTTTEMKSSSAGTCVRIFTWSVHHCTSYSGLGLGHPPPVRPA